jgi:adenylate cyclase
VKHIFSTFICLFLSSGHLFLFAQNADLQDLENQVIGASGAERLEKNLQYVEALLSAGQHEKAMKWAEDGSDFAKKIKRPDIRALLLNREGRAMLLAGKRKAASRFEQSNNILEDNGGNRSLMLDNYENLRQLAIKNGDRKDLLKVEEAISRLKNGPSALPSAPSVGAVLPPPPASTPITRQELKQELNNLQGKIMAVNKMSEEEKVRFLQENKQLQLQLSEQQTKIEQMTESQMKSSMMLMQQRFLLDSLAYEANMDSLAIANSNLALRESESSRYFYLTAMAAMLLLAGGSLFSYFKTRQYAKNMEVKNNMIREEQQRSEDLLLNILPALIADELKSKGRTTAKTFDDVGVLFADFVGFSTIAEKLSPEQLVNDLDTCFQAFDDIISKYSLEKIKTIGDAYMCAGGLPNGGGSQLRDMVNAALEIQKWLTEWNIKRTQQNLPRYEARIGIHRGPIVAGVVGSRKFAFDIWGDTVNIAARIEQAGERGRVNISGEAYQIIKEYFPCQYRGKIAAKNKGEIDMYFIEA